MYWTSISERIVDDLGGCSLSISCSEAMNDWNMFFLPEDFSRSTARKVLVDDLRCKPALSARDLVMRKDFGALGTMCEATVEVVLVGARGTLLDRCEEMSFIWLVRRDLYLRVAFNFAWAWAAVMGLAFGCGTTTGLLTFVMTSMNSLMSLSIGFLLQYEELLVSCDFTPGLALRLIMAWFVSSEVRTGASYRLLMLGICMMRGASAALVVVGLFCWTCGRPALSSLPTYAFL